MPNMWAWHSRLQRIGQSSWACGPWLCLIDWLLECGERYAERDENKSCVCSIIISLSTPDWFRSARDYMFCIVADAAQHKQQVHWLIFHSCLAYFQILFLTLVNVTTLVLCTSGPDGQPEIRKTSVRSPSPASAGTPALVNSLQSSQDAVAKVQSAQLYSRPATTADYNAIQSPHTSLFAQQYLGATGQHTSPTGHGSYLIALNSNGAQPTLMPTLLNNGLHSTTSPIVIDYDYKHFSCILFCRSDAGHHAIPTAKR